MRVSQHPFFSRSSSSSSSGLALARSRSASTSFNAFVDYYGRENSAHVRACGGGVSSH
jgi:hypothetical protein